jgi:uncharacterized protein (TIGR00645 family)
MANGDTVDASEHGTHASDGGEELEMGSSEQWLNRHFESRFFALRYTLLVPVIVAFIGSTVMFANGTYHTAKAMSALVIGQHLGSSQEVTLPIIKALDAFLVGIILVIFSFGIYDFFISELDPAERSSIRPDWFKFESTGELKNKLIEVVLVILAIKFFEQMVANADQITEIERFLVIPAGAAILAFSLGFFKWATE